jgi:hypothetical protein
MGMAVQEFLCNSLGHIIEVEATFLVGDLRIEHYLKQQITKLIAQLQEVTAFDSINDFIDFFQSVGSEGLKRLLSIPVTPMVGITKLPHDRQQLTQ